MGKIEDAINHVPDLHTLVETSHKELERVT